MKLEGKRLVLYAIKAVLIAIGLGIAIGVFLVLVLNATGIAIPLQHCLTLICIVCMVSFLEAEFFITKRIPDKYKVIKTLLTVHFGFCLFVLSFLFILIALNYANII